MTLTNGQPAKRQSLQSPEAQQAQDQSSEAGDLAGRDSDGQSSDRQHGAGALTSSASQRSKDRLNHPLEAVLQRDRYQQYLRWSPEQRDQARAERAAQLASLPPAETEQIAPLLAEQAMLLMASQRQDEAVPLWDQLLQRVPDQAQVWYSRGVALDQLKRYEEALASYDQVIQLRPSDHLAWGNRAIALRKLGRDQEAQAAARQAFALNKAGMVGSFFEQLMAKQPRLAGLLRPLQRLAQQISS